MEPPLPIGFVRVWHVGLDGAPETVEALRRWLSPDERERATRFRLDFLQRRFVMARGRLRQLLGQVLNRPPAALQFTYGPKGKPALAEPAGPIEFNLSHSHECAVVAVTAGRQIGVDIEWLDRRLTTFRELAQRYFAPEENAALERLPPSEQWPAFFRCWTRKEAMLKATGTGLTFPLNRLVVTLSATDCRLESYDGDPFAAAAWTLSSLAPPSGYVAALALEGTPGGLDETWLPADERVEHSEG